MGDLREKVKCEWAKLEQYIGFEVPICLKILLWKSGFDSMFSVNQLCENNIKEMENFIQTNRTQILTLLNEANDMREYENQKKFQFLPGHRNILLDLPECIKHMRSDVSCSATLLANGRTNVLCGSLGDNNEVSPEYSVILTELINTARKNKNRSKNAYQYDDIIKYFSTYI